MRYVPIHDLLQTIFADQQGVTIKQTLEKAHRLVTQKSADDRKAYINNNGTRKWSPLKDRFTEELGNKCWYTEAELVGAALTIDHFRPLSGWPLKKGLYIP